MELDESSVSNASFGTEFEALFEAIGKSEFTANGYELARISILAGLVLFLGSRMASTQKEEIGFFKNSSFTFCVPFGLWGTVWPEKELYRLIVSFSGAARDFSVGWIKCAVRKKAIFVWIQTIFHMMWRLIEKINKQERHTRVCLRFCLRCLCHTVCRGNKVSVNNTHNAKCRVTTLQRTFPSWVSSSNAQDVIPQWSLSDEQT